MSTAEAVQPDASPARKDEPLLRIENLKKYFPIKQGVVFQHEVARVHAVDDVSFDVFPGETVGLVGESGCGKSTLGRCAIRLHDLTDGKVIFDGTDISKLSRRGMRPLRREMQMIFQDPYASLNPANDESGSIIGEPLKIHNRATARPSGPSVQELLSAGRPQPRARQPLSA